MRADEVDPEQNQIRPFEWLTSPLSLQKVLLSALSSTQIPVGDEQPTTKTQQQQQRRVVLHVGCGSSLTGELLVEDPIYNVSSVVNVDCDKEVLQRMKDRWRQRHPENKNISSSLLLPDDNAMKFVYADFTLDGSLTEEYDAEFFDLVVDKSTLDCLLCADKAAAGLLAAVYRLLKPGGVYLVISFHSVDFLRPLLERLPGADWDVSCSTMMREVENLVVGHNNDQTKWVTTTATSTSAVVVEEHPRDTQAPSSSPGTVFDNTSSPVLATANEATSSSCWSSGTFEPDEQYRRTVNVLQCRKRKNAAGCSVTTPMLEWDAVYQHIHVTNNEWYCNINPMLSVNRRNAIDSAFNSNNMGSGEKELDLQTCYHILFTNAEREHLEYEDFVGDWETFLDNHPDVPVDRMSMTTAIAFLDEMQ